MTNFTANEVEKILPDEERRKIYLSLFSEALKKANSYGNNKWGAYCEDKRVRLLVGSLIVFTIHKNGIWLALDKKLLDKMTEKGISLENLEKNGVWRWHTGRYSKYDPVPSMNGWYFPSSDNLDSWHIIKNLHFEYLRKVAQHYQWLISTSQPKHSKELLEYLEKELGHSVPNPNYKNEPETPTLQTYAGLDKNYNELSEMTESYFPKFQESIDIEFRNFPLRNLKEIDQDETEEKAFFRENGQISYTKNEEKQEKANKQHRNTLSQFKKYLLSQKLVPKESKVIDLLVENKNKVFIFEVKSIHKDNFKYQTRSAIGQLFEYEYFQVKKKSNFKYMEIQKSVIYSKEPPKRFIDFLEACNFGVYWISNNEITGSEESMKLLTSFVQL